VLLVPALAVALSLAFAGGASAQTPFQATVTGTLTHNSPGCSSPTAFFCGTANIAGYGPATWNLYITGNTNVPSPCGSTYTAVTEFTLVSDPASTLELNEAGDLCGLGHDGAAYRGYFAEGSKAFGHPYEVVGTWTVDPATSTGQFKGDTGSGTDTLHVAGAHFAGSYSGLLG
jgi:hypothetical protein